GDLARPPRHRPGHPQPVGRPPGQSRDPELLRQPARQAPLGRPDERRTGFVEMSEKKDGAPKRQPGRMRRYLVRPFLWCLVLPVASLVGLLLLLCPRFFLQRFTTFAISQASDLLQRPVRVASLSYSLFPLEIELRGVVVPGPTPADAPWATIDLLRIQV